MQITRRTKQLALFISLFLVILVSVVFYFRNSSPKPISTRGGKNLESLSILQVPLYKQWDPSWAEEEIGGSGEKFRSVGCAVSCVAMLFSYYGIEVTPKIMNDYLKEHEGYTRQGWLKWQQCADYTQGKVLLEYVGNPNYECIDENLEKKNPVIVKVFLAGKIPHWVLIVGKQGGEYWVNDPLGPELNPIPLSKYDTKMHALRIYRQAS